MKKVLRILLNKYTITGAAFAALMLVFDQNNYMSMKERNDELKSVNANIAFLNQEIAKMDASYASLMQDPKELERYAREHYRMKKDNEDLYIVEKK